MYNNIYEKFDSKTIELEDMVLSRSNESFDVRLRVHEFILEFLKRYKKETTKQTQSNHNNKIWVYWGQGKNAMPPIVRMCYKQLYLFHESRDIILLDDENISDYVTIPDYVYTKLRDNKTHFSDVLRVALLEQHGGTWIDATCYCSGSTEPLYESALKTGYFAYSFIEGKEFLLSSWFMTSRPNAIIPWLLKDALYYYWSEREEIEHYYMFHYMFEALYNLNAEFRACWDARLFLNREPPHELQRRLFKDFCIDKWNEIMKISLVHKLTYKYPDGEYKGTYLSHILG